MAEAIKHKGVQRCEDCGGGGRVNRDICEGCNGSGDTSVHVRQTKEFQDAVAAEVAKVLGSAEKSAALMLAKKAAKPKKKASEE